MSSFSRYSNSEYLKESKINSNNNFDNKNLRLSIRIPNSLNYRINRVINLLPIQIKDRSDFGRKAVNMYLKQLEIAISEYDLILNALKKISQAQNIIINDLEDLLKERCSNVNKRQDLINFVSY